MNIQEENTKKKKITGYLVTLCMIFIHLSECFSTLNIGNSEYVFLSMYKYISNNGQKAPKIWKLTFIYVEWVF